MQQTTATATVDALLAEGKKQNAAGHFDEALRNFDEGARGAHALSDQRREAKALLSISGCQIRLFRYRAALESAEAARALALAAKDDSLAGAATGNLSTIYSQLGDFAQANRQAERSVGLLEHSARKDYLAKALLNLGDIQSNEGSTKEARKTYEQAIAAAREAGKPGLESMAWDHAGIALLLHGYRREAENALNKAYQLRLSAHDENGLAFTREHLAELELDKKDYSASLKLIDDAFAAESQDFKTSPQYYPIHIRGLILLQLHRTPEALAEFRLAVASANQWRQGALPGDVTSTRTVAILHDVYQDYTQLAAELALKRGDGVLAREALEAIAENRAASLREQLARALGRDLRLPPRYFELLSEMQSLQSRVTLRENPYENEAKLLTIRVQLSELENQIGIETLNIASPREKTPHKNSLRDIQSSLSGSEMLLSFCLGKDKSFLWAVTGDHVDLYELPRESEIATKSRAFSEGIRHGSKTGHLGQSLSQELFGKLPIDASRKPDWLIVADGALLSGVPFAALPDPYASSDSPLTTAHTLRFLPSELLLATARGPEPEQRFLGVGDPIYNAADSRRAANPAFVQTKHANNSIALARLAGSNEEIPEAAKMSGMPETQILVGPDASGTRLRDALQKRPEVLHFAVHVVSPPERPQEAALALSMTQDDMPELLTAEAIAAYRVPGALVVLSGCSSDQGKTVASAGVIGLSRAWLLAGAAAVIVSVWPTPDDSGQFFSAFYGHFQRMKTGSPAERAATALRAAQLDMQRSGGYRSSPSFWAAYSIVSKE